MKGPVERAIKEVNDLARERFEAQWKPPTYVDISWKTYYVLAWHAIQEILTQGVTVATESGFVAARPILPWRKVK